MPVSKLPMQWSLNRLRSREDPLVLFTLLTQAVVGAFAVLFLGPLLGLESLSLTAHPVAYPVTLFVLIAIQTFALVISVVFIFLGSWRATIIPAVAAPNEARTVLPSVLGTMRGNSRIHTHSHGMPMYPLRL